MLADAKVRLERIVRELREAQASRESIQAAHHGLGELASELANPSEPEGVGSSGPAVPPRGDPGANLAPGARVWVDPLGREGTLEEVAPDGKARVRLGNVPVSVRADDLRVLGGPTEAPSPGGYSATEPEPVEPRLDIRGLERDDALRALDRFLDQMLRQGVPSAVIVHGKGQGVLRRSIQEHLARHPDVAEFRLGQHTEGGSGATIVRLR